MKICIADGYRFAGPSGNVGPGGIVDVTEAQALEMERAGYGQRVDAMPKYEPEPEATPEPEPERQTKPEIATSRAARKRERATEI